LVIFDAVGCWWMKNCFIFRHVFEVAAICKSGHLLFNMLMTGNTVLMQRFEVFYIQSFVEMILNTLDKRAWLLSGHEWLAPCLNMTILMKETT
jgi:hypothetical protein